MLHYSVIPGYLSVSRLYCSVLRRLVMISAVSSHKLCVNDCHTYCTLICSLRIVNEIGCHIYCTGGARKKMVHLAWKKSIRLNCLGSFWLER
jgi:hypothetical protein